MKTGIHPKYNDNCKVSCACGNTFTTGSTLDHIDVEVCSKCHPAYTGVLKFVDIKGKIDRFREKQAKGEANRAKKVATKAKKAQA